MLKLCVYLCFFANEYRRQLPKSVGESVANSNILHKITVLTFWRPGLLVLHCFIGIYVLLNLTVKLYGNKLETNSNTYIYIFLEIFT